MNSTKRISDFDSRPRRVGKILNSDLKKPYTDCIVWVPDRRTQPRLAWYRGRPKSVEFARILEMDIIRLGQVHFLETEII